MKAASTPITEYMHIEEVTEPTEIEDIKLIKTKKLREINQNKDVIINTVTEEERQKPKTRVIEGSITEIIDNILPLSESTMTKPSKKKETTEQIKETDKTVEKHKKITKKKIIKRKEQKQPVVEEVTVEEKGQLPVITITEGPLEEIVEETILLLPDYKTIKPSEEEEVREQVTVTEEVVEGEKPKKITKKKVIKRKGQKQQITEEVTVEEKGQLPVTTITEGPLEEIVEDTVFPLPDTKIKSSEEEEVRRQITVTEEVVEGERPKKITKKKIIKRKGQKQQITEEVTVEEKGQLPVTTITEGPLEEIVEETVFPISDYRTLKPSEEEEVREQVIVTEEVVEGEKPKKMEEMMREMRSRVRVEREVGKVFGRQRG
ncbi:LOW QUALITY PROTEIN: neurofilament medium polypeptide-like [Pogonomyrmex barbatus]|uniref:LOW QUALITY PROTEIN: neurofilament medium polypeptide-like n=1 Tax=Pogonomyrmex barbatus TaxID=144034 RepID=A0A8N1S3T5_9HYME|nr:LOW QUALITY PROTEIN: neurofilament medium polypeptide-like [Pogonomyrmex barbatus]